MRKLALSPRTPCRFSLRSGSEKPVPARTIENLNWDLGFDKAKIELRIEPEYDTRSMRSHRERNTNGCLVTAKIWAYKIGPNSLM